MNKAFRRKGKLSTEKPVILISISTGGAVGKFFMALFRQSKKEDIHVRREK